MSRVTLLCLVICALFCLSEAIPLRFCRRGPRGGGGGSTPAPTLPPTESTTPPHVCPMCVANCPISGERYVGGCSTCQCNDPCEGVTCDQGQQCQEVQPECNDQTKCFPRSQCVGGGSSSEPSSETHPPSTNLMGDRPEFVTGVNPTEPDNTNNLPVMGNFPGNGGSSPNSGGDSTPVNPVGIPPFSGANQQPVPGAGQQPNPLGPPNGNPNGNPLGQGNSGDGAPLPPSNNPDSASTPIPQNVNPNQPVPD